tara:strand:+ start:2703 stop:4532 length:1830 start_codon:yes stop_codon:yes gene_type:complete
MPVKVNGKYLVPAPLVTFGKNYLRSENGETIGAEYTISLAGTLLPNKGNPVVDSGTFESSFSTDSWAGTKSPDDDPNHQLDVDDSLLSIMSKQEEIRKLFSPGQAVKVEILDLNLRGKGIKFVGNVNSISFPDEGRWALPCPYNIDLSTTNFLESSDGGDFTENYSEDEFKYFVKSASETWDISENEQKFYTGHNSNNVIKTYNISHNISAVGQAAYSATGTFDADGDQAQTNKGRYDAPYVSGLAPWQQASGYVHNVIQDGSGNLPIGSILDTNETFSFGDTFFENNGNNLYILTDRTFTENIDIRGGGYSVTESYKAFPSGAFTDNIPAIASHNINVSVSNDGLTQVTIDGTINGLNTISPQGLNNESRHETNSLKNALQYYNNFIYDDISAGTAQNTRAYHMARNAASLTWLHPKPLSSSRGINPNGGVVTYNAQFDDRPPNIINGSITEEISINDTHPGQIFASIPVIGRNQPVLQYLNSRSEYKRSLSINVNMSPFASNWTEDSGAIITAGGYWADAVGVDTAAGAVANDGITWWLYTKKPSVTNAADFQKIFDAANPANETAANGFSNYVIPGRCFHSAPTESWNPKTGQYSYSIEWTYERIN